MTDTSKATHRETEQLKAFLVSSTDYYTNQFTQIANGKTLSINSAAMLWGPLWAASRGIWGLFWVLAATDVIGLS